MLMSILNKAISHISDDEKGAIVQKELLLHPYEFHFNDIWYKYWKWFVIAIIVIIIALIVYTTMTHRMAKLKIEQHENEMLRAKLQLDEITGLYNRTHFYKTVHKIIETKV